MQTVAIIDYGSGNLRSVAKAFERMAIETGLSLNVKVTSDSSIVSKADRLVLPGVGAFADCYKSVMASPGLREALHVAVIEKTRPFLGICVGMQLMATSSYEHSITPGFNWITGNVVAIKTTGTNLKIPHMGWNELKIVSNDHPVCNGLQNGTIVPHVYFVHSYHLTGADSQNVIATTEYGNEIVAVIGRDNMVGTQFHPEKSQAAGLRLISNFLAWSP
mgnify:CR=1 FL=1|jgi:glutamine amidotransferase|tara:strand:- start:1330 stop:1986 length:657 start_codon:yes stop_codon:yes gene_type:complete